MYSNLPTSPTGMEFNGAMIGSRSTAQPYPAWSSQANYQLSGMASNPHNGLAVGNQMGQSYTNPTQNLSSYEFSSYPTSTPSHHTAQTNQYPSNNTAVKIGEVELPVPAHQDYSIPINHNAVNLLNRSKSQPLMQAAGILLEATRKELLLQQPTHPNFIQRDTESGKMVFITKPKEYKPIRIESSSMSRAAIINQVSKGIVGLAQTTEEPSSGLAGLLSKLKPTEFKFDPRVIEPHEQPDRAPRQFQPELAGLANRTGFQPVPDKSAIDKEWEADPWQGFVNTRRDQYPLAGGSDSPMRGDEEVDTLFSGSAFFSPGTLLDGLEQQEEESDNWTTSLARDFSPDRKPSTEPRDQMFDFGQLSNLNIEEAVQGLQDDAVCLSTTTNLQKLLDRKKHADQRSEQSDLQTDDAGNDPALDLHGTKIFENWTIDTFTPTQAVELVENQTDEHLLNGISSLIGATTCHFNENAFKWQMQLDGLVSKGHTYKDLKFFGFKALIGFEQFSRPAFYSKYEWKLANDCFDGSKPICIVEGSIEPDDILQGDLGDCYLLAALASIAEHPKRIERLIPSKTINNAGIYCVQICVTGIWEQIILDDLFPYCPKNKRPAFNHSNSHEI